MSSFLQLKCTCGGVMRLVEIVDDPDAGTVLVVRCACGRTTEILPDGYTITHDPAGECETGVISKSDIEVSE